MALANTSTHYGSVTRTFHWLTALLILTAMPLGVIANSIPIESDAQIAQKTLLFSLHKTVGLTAFFVALARIGWAFTQTRPAALHPDRRAETFAAATVHWALYISLVLVPLSGWLHHAATTGFAPIWWPFGQSLPFVPVDAGLAEFFAAWHWLFTKVLLVSILAHVAGAIKHAVIDRDVTLTRITSGNCEVPATDHRETKGPLFAAIAIWIATLAGGSALGLSHEEVTAAELDAASGGGWTVDTGTLAITVSQLGTEVGGSFSDWTATIDFDPDAAGELKGEVDVAISIVSLTLGTVTDQALGTDFFDASTHPTATYSGPIVEDPAGDGYLVLGVLSLKGAAMPVELPFELQLAGDTALVAGSTTLDRRDFAIGDTITDEGSLGFAVQVDLDLVATKN